MKLSQSPNRVGIFAYYDADGIVDDYIPVLVGAALLGAGVLWYAARQRSKQRDVIEGQAQRLPPGADGQDEYGV